MTEQQRVAHAAYMREWRRRNPGYTTKFSRAWSEKYPERHKAQQRKWAEKNRHQRLASYPTKLNGYLRRLYGLTLEQYKAMLDRQGGACAGCGHSPGEGEQRLCVDHDAKTGKVRELLCRGCNLSIGNTKENPETLRRLALYVERHGVEE